MGDAQDQKQLDDKSYTLEIVQKIEVLQTTK